MKPVYVNGTGIISAAALTADELSENLKNNSLSKKYTLPFDFPSEVPSSKLRRCSRYIKMTCAAADQAVRDVSGKYIPERQGAVFSTGFGAAESNITFSDSVVKGNPALCSPSVFSATVPNSCLGQICIINGLRGEGTMLMGGDPSEYSALLLNMGKADVIYCGGVEEYSSELYESLEIKGAELSEGAAVLALSAEKNVNSYCAVTGFSSAAFPESPFRNTDDLSYEIIQSAVSSAKIPDIIFAAGNGSGIDEAEIKAFDKIYPDKKVIYPKKYFGEALGAGYIQSAVLAAVCLKNKIIPSCDDVNFGNILVCGFDCVGNYTCMNMEAL